MIKKFSRNHSLIVFYKPDWKILFQDRRNMAKDGAEYWFFGWWVDEWENFEQACIRETKEELNLKISNSDINLASNFSKSITWYGTSENYIYVSLYKESYNKDIQILEGKGWVWWTLKEAKKQIFFNHDYMIFAMLEIFWSIKRK